MDSRQTGVDARQLQGPIIVSLDCCKTEHRHNYRRQLPPFDFLKLSVGTTIDIVIATAHCLQHLAGCKTARNVTS